MFEIGGLYITRNGIFLLLLESVCIANTRLFAGLPVETRLEASAK